MNNNTSTAIETLLYRNGLSEKDIQDAFALFSGYDIDYADFYFQRSVSEGYVLEESIVKTGHYNTDMGVAFVPSAVKNRHSPIQKKFPASLYSRRSEPYEHCAGYEQPNYGQCHA